MSFEERCYHSSLTIWTWKKKKLMDEDEVSFTVASTSPLLLERKMLKRGAKTQLEDSLKDSAAVQVYMYKTREIYLMLVNN